MIISAAFESHSKGWQKEGGMRVQDRGRTARRMALSFIRGILEWYGVAAVMVLLVGVLVAVIWNTGAYEPRYSVGLAAEAEASARIVSPVPHDPPYNAQLITDWGSGRALDGIGALNYLQRTAPPTIFLNIERRYPGDRLVGEVQVNGVVTSETSMTLTVSADDRSPDSMILTMPCVMQPPIGATATVSGTIVSVSCPIDRSGCILSGNITVLGGNTCP